MKIEIEIMNYDNRITIAIQGITIIFDSITENQDFYILWNYHEKICLIPKNLYLLNYDNLPYADFQQLNPTGISKLNEVIL